MPVKMPIVEARKRLTRIPEELANNQEVIEITRRGEPVLALISWDFYESLMETMEVMADEELMALLRKSIGEAKAGRTVSLAAARKKLSL